MRYLAIAVLFLVPLAASADTVTISTVFNSGPESIAAQVDWNTSTNQFIVGSDRISSQGPLGAFSLLFAQGLSFPRMPLIDWIDAAGDFFQIDGANLPADAGKFPALGSYSPSYVDLYCQSAACVNLGGFGIYFGDYGAKGSVTVTDPPDAPSTPEPNELSLLLVGLAALIPVCALRNGNRSPVT